MHIASSAYRIVSVGIEPTVYSYTPNLVDTPSGKRYTDYLKGESDSGVPYADIVLISHCGTIAPYLNLIELYKARKGMSRLKAQEVKPIGSVAAMKKVRVYWYPVGSQGYKNRNLGMRDLLAQIYVSDSSKKRHKEMLDSGDADPNVAFKVLGNIKSSHDTKGPNSHLTCLILTKFVPRIARTIVGAIKPGHSYLWRAGSPDSRSSYKWKEDVHGAAISAFLDFQASSKDVLDGELFLDSVYPASKSEEDVPQKVIHKAVQPKVTTVQAPVATKLIALCWGTDGAFGKLKLPDGTTIDEEDKRWSEMVKAYKEQESKE